MDFADASWTGENPPLSNDGVLQAIETGERLKGEGIKQIFASPFLRTVETAHHIAKALELKIKIEHGASEWLNQAWFSKPPDHIPVEGLMKRFPSIDPNYRSKVIPQYPEDLDLVMARTARTIHLLIDEYGEDILIVSHGRSVIGMSEGLVKGGCGLSPGLCCLVKIVRKGGSARVELDCDTSHLSNGEQHTKKFHPLSPKAQPEGNG